MGADRDPFVVEADAAPGGDPEQVTDTRARVREAPLTWRSLDIADGRDLPLPPSPSATAPGSGRRLRREDPRRAPLQAPRESPENGHGEALPRWPVHFEVPRPLARREELRAPLPVSCASPCRTLLGLGQGPPGVDPQSVDLRRAVRVEHHQPGPVGSGHRGALPSKGNAKRLRGDPLASHTRVS